MKIFKTLSICLLSSVLLFGCSAPNEPENPTPKPEAPEEKDEMASFIDYFKTAGVSFVQNTTMKPSYTHEGFIEGKVYDYDDMQFEVYRYDITNEKLNALANEAMYSGKVELMQNNELIQVPALVKNGYLITYGSDYDITAIKDLMDKYK